MKLRHARELLDYWKEFPPENEMLVMLAQVYTTWKPASARAMTPEDHQRSLEERWKAGAMNAKQIFESMGGGAKVIAVQADGTMQASHTANPFVGVN